MNKNDLAAAVAAKTGMQKKEGEAVVNAVLEAITASLVRGEKVHLVGFGTFEVKERAGFTGHDPRSMNEIEIPAAKVPSFKPGTVLKAALKQ